MPNRTHQDQAQATGAQADETANRGHAAAQVTGDQAHQDAVDAIRANREGNKALRDGNPFSLTNILLAIGIAFMAWAGEQVYGGMQENQKATKEWMLKLSAKMDDTHDAVMQHGYKLDSLQNDVTVLKANCVTRESMDARIRALESTTQPHGGGNMSHVPGFNGLATTNVGIWNF
jgi:hypothetical protein